MDVNGVPECWQLPELRIWTFPGFRSFVHFVIPLLHYSITPVIQRGCLWHSHCSVRTIRKIGVIGSGNIGPDIALHFSQNLYTYGVPVVVVDILQAALDAGSKKAESKMAKAAEKGIFKKEAADAIFKNMLFTTDYGTTERCRPYCRSRF